MTVILGIDTSHHQQLPDFAALRRGGIGFILAKATEGTGFADPQYAASRAGAHAAGMIFGSYHFARPGDPVAQADYYLSVARPVAGEIPALDLEDQAIPDPAGFSRAWCERVHAKTGCWPLIYLNSWFLANYDWTPVMRDGDGLWLAKYDGRPAGGPNGVWPVIAVKQFTDRATVPGQPGQVDEDSFNGDLAALTRYAIPGGTDKEDDMSYDADKANLYATLTADRNQLAGWVRDNINVAVKVLTAQIAGLTAVVQQLAAHQGTPVDMAAVEAIVQKGVADAIASIDTTITIKPAPPASS